MRRLWLIFAQTVTVCVAALFVLKTLRPDWLPSWQLQQLSPSTGSVSNPLFGAGPTSSGDTAAAPQAVASYADAAQVALPSVVHIFTSQEVRSPKHPFLNDPLFRHFSATVSAKVRSGARVLAAGWSSRATAMCSPTTM